MAEKKKMSVSDILAAARKADAAGDAADEPPESAAGGDESSGAAAAPGGGQGSKPAAKPAAGGERPGVADILAKARGEKKKVDPPAGKAAAKKPAAQPAAAKPAAKKAAASGPARDTASILAAARNPQKKGPMSKAEAAARGTTDAPRGKAKLEVPPMPEKPAYAVSKQPAGRRTVDPQRRATVLSLMLSMLVGSGLALGFASLTATLGLWTLGLARFMFPNVLREPPSRFKVGFPSDFVAGQVETKFKAKFGVWLVSWEYNGEAQIYALKSVCTHLGCTPNWLEAEQKFKCPCHGSGFYKDGINFEGPAPRPLERYAIQIADDGQLEIDKSRTFQEEMGQWADPTSYVSV